MSPSNSSALQQSNDTGTQRSATQIHVQPAPVSIVMLLLLPLR